MNSDRIIKVLEWRPQISVSSDNTYDPDDRKDLEECMLDVFKQFCEFKKKEYNLTLGTSLDTQELRDMDVAILICSIEKAFGVEIPHDELASMDTFNDIATYINDYHKKQNVCDKHKNQRRQEKRATVTKALSDRNRYRMLGGICSGFRMVSNYNDILHPGRMFRNRFRLFYIDRICLFVDRCVFIIWSFKTDMH